MTRTENEAPAVVNHPLFRSRVRDYLVSLGNGSPGLGLKVTGQENAVVIFPRAGRSPKTLAEFRGLTWMEVKVEGDNKNQSFSFIPMTADDVKTFLESIQPVPAQ